MGAQRIGVEQAMMDGKHGRGLWRNHLQPSSAELRAGAELGKDGAAHSPNPKV
jgi:hypothetical protein